MIKGLSGPRPLGVILHSAASFVFGRIKFSWKKKLKVKLLLVFFYAFLCISTCLADISIFLRCRRVAFAAALPETLYEIHHFLETPFLRSMLVGDFSRKTNAVCNKW